MNKKGIWARSPSIILLQRLLLLPLANMVGKVMINKGEISVICTSLISSLCVVFSFSSLLANQVKRLHRFCIVWWHWGCPLHDVTWFIQSHTVPFHITKMFLKQIILPLEVNDMVPHSLEIETYFSASCNILSLQLITEQGTAKQSIRKTTYKNPRTSIQVA